MSLKVRVYAQSVEHLGIALAGDLDVYTSPTFRDQLGGLLDKNVTLTLDLAGVGFCDSQGISSLMWASHQVEKLTVRLPEGHRVLRLFEITGLVKLFNTQTY